MPLITALVANYNHERFVEECLAGVAAQDYPNLDLIVMDDCSRDRSPEIIRSWLARHFPSARFIHHDRNAGICRTLNEAISLSRGEFISMIAADDIWEPGKLRRQVELLSSLSSSVGVVYSDAYQIDETGQLLPKRFIEAHEDVNPVPTGQILEALWDGNFIPAMTTMIRKSCYQAVGLYDTDLYAEDWDMWLRMAERFDFYYDNWISAKYRVVGTSMVRSGFPRLVDGNIRMIRKWLTRSDLASSLRTKITKKLAAQALLSYQHSSPACRENLRLACRFRPSPGVFLAAAMAALGFPFARYRNLRQSLRWGS